MFPNNSLGPTTAITLLRLWLEGEFHLTRPEVMRLLHIVDTELEGVRERIIFLDGWPEAKGEE